MGNRVVDAYNITYKTIAESKYGYQGLSKFIQSEIERESWLLNNNFVEQVEWHFYYSAQSGTFGPSGPLCDALKDAGLTIVFH